MKYVYPKLPAVKSFPFLRIGGSGLANCLFVYCKSIVLANKYKAFLIHPTWLNLSLGTYIRNQQDKRHYKGLFLSNNEVTGIKKLLILLFKKRVYNEEFFYNSHDDLLVVEGIYDFFNPLLHHHKLLNDYLLTHINPQLLKKVESFDFTSCVAVHVRLGDFPASRRIPMHWYLSKIKCCNNYKRILLFSDGKDEELTLLLKHPKVERVFFGGAIQDIIAISKCSYLIGSDSSFSAWGAFLGQVPSIFYRLQFGQVLLDKSKQIIEND